MPKRSSKRQNDRQELARKVFDSVVPDAEDKPTEEQEPEKNPAAVALGRLGGLKGGKARAKKLTAKKRSEIAKKAAAARWKNAKKSE
ncbi:MAG: hypothetical protein IH898_12685 [Planctomycetes bacterium]|nr:hypothetical protein [Planctomycetota bacterium]